MTTARNAATQPVSRRLPISQQWSVRIGARQPRHPDVGLLAQAVLALGEQLQRATAHNPAAPGGGAPKPSPEPIEHHAATPVSPPLVQEAP